jgi:BirA family transcriptional regulator, biotin operon repressor / biotin---[acetyl-CoA-carboxylase] ligase
VELGDLSEDSLGPALHGRPLRSYRALVSTHAEALAWARAGAPEGAVVVADYQASPRGRAGLEWKTAPGEGLGFSLVLRPDLPAEREGWLYAVATAGIADAAGPEAAIEWPDEVRLAGERFGAVGLHVEIGAHGDCAWAVATLLVPGARPPRGTLLGVLLDAIEARYLSEPGPVLAEYTARCATLGRHVRARLIPMGPAGPAVTGTAVAVREDGSLVLETAEGRRVAVPPQALGLLDDAEPGDLGPDEP